MRQLFVHLIFALLLIPQFASAEGRISRRDGPATASAVTRRDGFLFLWRSIGRPAEVSREIPFTDVQKNALGFLEITYAKSRGILDDASPFHPDDSLQILDALVWLFRTRNVDDADQITRDRLSVYLEKYPLLFSADHLIAWDPAYGSAALMGRAGTTLVTGDQLASLALDLDAALREEVHEVSLYAEEFHGKGTAFGETFDMNALTAAHRSLPWNTLVRVTNVESGTSVTVRINDRGPYVSGRDMDLSLAAFTTLAPRSQGTLRARFERLGDARTVGPCGGGEKRFQRRLSRKVHFTRGIPHAFSLGGTLTLAANKPFVLRAISYPDGTSLRLQDFIHPDEKYSFTPSIEGTYSFRIGTVEGRVRTFRMHVLQCEAQGA